MDIDPKAVFTPEVRRIFTNMIKSTQTCLDNTPNRTFEKDLKCEVAMFSDKNTYTFHTHPNGNPSPSELDRRTTAKFGKKLLIIGLVPQREIVYYGAWDGFKRVLGRFSV